MRLEHSYTAYLEIWILTVTLDLLLFIENHVNRLAT